MDLSTLITQNSPLDQFPREFRIDPQYRRSCLYLVIGGWIVIGTMFFVGAAMGNPIDTRIWPGLIVFGLAPITLWLYVTTYRLRLDEWGISRRRFWWWTLWPWESFAEGEVLVDKLLYKFQTRPFWDRYVVAIYLPEGDQKFLQDIVERTVPAQCLMEGRRLKLSVEKVSEVTLRLVLFRKLRVSDLGCELVGRGISWRWESIFAFRIEARKTGEGKDVYYLIVTGNDGSGIRGYINQVSLPGSSVVPHMTGHDEWIPHVQSFVPLRCWKYLRMKGELQSLEEGEFRLAQWKNPIRFMRWIEIAGWVCLPFAVFFFGQGIIVWWNIPFLALGWKLLFTIISLLMMVMLPLLICGMARYQQWRFQRKIDETNQQIEAFLKPQQHAANLSEGVAV